MTAVRRTRVAAALLCVLALVGALLTSQASMADEVEVDTWGSDPNSLSGTVDEICGPGPRHDAAAARDGRVELIAWLDETFPEVQGFAGFSCREIHNRRTSCAGRDRPDSSDCWSTHAAGRAIDVMVGGAGNQDGYPVGGELGDRIVNHLLAPVNGVDNYLARVMGIQQLLWNGTCWSAREHGDLGITDVSQLGDDCIDDHDNHVHITLSEAGADGTTSFHTGEVADPDLVEALPIRDQHLVLYDAKDGALEVRGMEVDGSLAADALGVSRMARGFTSMATPDVGGNGDNEVFAYREVNGKYVIREIRDNGRLGDELGGSEELEPGWTLVATPDVDGDGDDELLLYRGDDGAWVLHELLENGELGPAVQADDAPPLDVFHSNAATPDLDGDGDDEVVFYRRFDGGHEVLDFDLAANLPDPDPDDVEADDDADDEEVAPPVLDADQDGLVDPDIVLTPLDVPAPDEDGAEEGDEDAADEQGAEDAPDEATDDVDQTDAISTALTAGFSSIAAVDVDHDGRDELALYREGDGCLAIRRSPVAPFEEASADDAEIDGAEASEVDEADAADEQDVQATEDDADVVAEGEVIDPTLPPCLPTADDDTAAKDAEETDEAVEADDEAPTPVLDPAAWLVEDREGVQPGWTALLTAAVGDEYVVDPTELTAPTRE